MKYYSIKVSVLVNGTSKGVEQHWAYGDGGKEFALRSIKEAIKQSYRQTQPNDIVEIVAIHGGIEEVTKEWYEQHNGKSE